VTTLSLNSVFLFRRVLISEGLLEPRAIAVDPVGGHLFWSDWGANPHIGRAWMDGSNAEVVISKGIGWPNALAIDFATRELYFGDARFVLLTDIAHTWHWPTNNTCFWSFPERTTLPWWAWTAPDFAKCSRALPPHPQGAVFHKLT
jgi:hypothetical protein